MKRQDDKTTKILSVDSIRENGIENAIQYVQTKKESKKRKVLLVIFGGTGDLANRKLLPAVYNIFAQNKTDLHLDVLVIGRRQWDKADYIKQLKPWVDEFSRLKFTEEKFQDFSEHVNYFKMQINEPTDYTQLFQYFEAHYAGFEKIFYYAVAPKFFSEITKGLKQRAWDTTDYAKIIIEKPFGETLEQAVQLYQDITELVPEEQIFHIDHYLGKEMIQNILTLRFENIIFKNSWNKDCIASIEINANEEVGVETRGAYYDHVGAMRDMMQNHLFQILSILTMEKPEKNNSLSLTIAQQNLLQALRPIKKDELAKVLCLAQYEGYQAEAKVNPESTTDTYAALVVHIDNSRWQDVPIFIRTGKKMKKRGTYVVINFKKMSSSSMQDRLVIEIQPDEGVYLSFTIKKPGITNEIEQVGMNFCQSCDLKAHENTPEAYERLLGAAIEEQRELFSQWPQIVFSWHWINNVLALWAESGKPLESYAQQSFGPSKAAEMLALYNAKWYEFEDINQHIK